MYAKGRQAGEQFESVMDAFIPGGPTKGVARWQMDVIPEDFNRGNNLVLEQRRARPNTLDYWIRHSPVEKSCGANYRDCNQDAAWSQAAGAVFRPKSCL
jgi:hypothetical protein